MKTSEALTSIAQALLRFRGADKIAPDLGTISRAVRECAPLVKADASDQTSIIIELALHYIRAHQIERHAVQEFRAAHGVREASPEPPTSSDLKVPSRHKDAA